MRAQKARLIYEWVGRGRGSGCMKRGDRVGPIAGWAQHWLMPSSSFSSGRSMSEWLVLVLWLSLIPLLLGRNYFKMRSLTKHVLGRVGMNWLARKMAATSKPDSEWEALETDAGGEPVRLRQHTNAFGKTRELTFRIGETFDDDTYGKKIRVIGFYLILRHTRSWFDFNALKARAHCRAAVVLFVQWEGDWLSWEDPYKAPVNGTFLVHHWIVCGDAGTGWPIAPRAQVDRWLRSEAYHLVGTAGRWHFAFSKLMHFSLH